MAAKTHNFFVPPAEDYLLEVQMGRVPGARLIVTQSYNPSVSTTTEDIWNAGGVYTWLDAATVMKLSSSSTSDIVTGDGARTALLSGLDADYNEISEVLSLNGQTAVNTVNSYLRVYSVRVLTTGLSQASNIGTLYLGTGTVTAGVPAVVHLHMLPAENFTMAGRYTVPAGHTGYLIEHGFSVAGAGDRVTCLIMVRPFGESFFVRRRFMVVENNFVFRGFAITPEKTDIVQRARTASGTGDIAAHFALLLIKN